LFLEGNYPLDPQNINNTDIVSVAIKKLRISNFKPWGSRKMAVWSEGSRLAECQLIFEAFKSRATHIILNLAGE
jgi:hypothetical protein